MFGTAVFGTAVFGTVSLAAASGVVKRVRDDCSKCLSVLVVGVC